MVGGAGSLIGPSEVSGTKNAATVGTAAAHIRSDNAEAIGPYTIRKSAAVILRLAETVANSTAAVPFAPSAS